MKSLLADHLIQHRIAFDREDAATRQDDRRWMRFLRGHLKSVSRLPPCRTPRDAQEATAEVLNCRDGRPMIGDETEAALLQRLQAFHNKATLSAIA